MQSPCDFPDFSTIFIVAKTDDFTSRNTDLRDEIYPKTEIPSFDFVF
nr:MAG TPA: hypothetical protein [Caudoviricetes sp.]